MGHVHIGSLASLQEDIKDLSITEALVRLTELFPGAVSFSTSFSNEDQVITDIISTSKAAISIFTLDTGRLFPETYSAWSRTLEKYKLEIKGFYPDKKQLQLYVTENGPNAFYQSLELRKRCCYIRKVVPLKKALQHKAIWITGLRAEHSPDRQRLSLLEWDDHHHVIKYHPLLHWNTAEVRNYITQHQVPYNPLHDKGFLSIGCAPCTRAIQPGEDFRAGRWWWEDDSKKECGLHINKIK